MRELAIGWMATFQVLWLVRYFNPSKVMYAFIVAVHYSIAVSQSF
jgi:hypothetical protein